MCVTPTPSIRGAGRAQHQAEMDAQGLPGQRCDKSRHDTSTSLRGGVRTWRYGRGPAVPLSMPKKTFATQANKQDIWQICRIFISLWEPIKKMMWFKANQDYLIGKLQFILSFLSTDFRWTGQCFSFISRRRTTISIMFYGHFIQRAAATCGVTLACPAAPYCSCRVEATSISHRNSFNAHLYARWCKCS